MREEGTEGGSTLTVAAPSQPITLTRGPALGYLRKCTRGYVDAAGWGVPPGATASVSFTDSVMRGNTVPLPVLRVRVSIRTGTAVVTRRMAQVL